MVRQSILLFSLFLLGGCAPTGDWSTMYWPDGPPIIANAPEAGRYQLYSNSSPIPIRKTTIRAGDPIGFSFDDKGRLIAVAASKSWRIPKGSSYYWLLPSAPEPDEPDEPSVTAEVVLGDLLESFVENLPAIIESMSEDSGSEHRHNSDHHEHHHGHDHNPPTTRP